MKCFVCVIRQLIKCSHLLVYNISFQLKQEDMTVSDEKIAEYKGCAMKTKAGVIMATLGNASIG